MTSLSEIRSGAFDVVSALRLLAGEIEDMKAVLNAGGAPSVNMDAGGQGADLGPGDTTLIVKDGLRGLLNDRLVQVLERAGYGTVASIAGATDEELRAVNGVGVVTLREIRELIPGEA